MTDTLTLAFSPDLAIPIDIVTERTALIGISGGGKTYAGSKLAELIHDAGAQVVIVDTVGNWWGLRLDPGGKKPGIQIPILGGDRGDVALDPGHGRLVAETIAETRASMILDVSEMTGGELRRFVTDFATWLLRLKKKRPGPVLVIWEECQDVVPQKVFGEDAKMVGAVEKLVKQGRNHGVGSMLLSQQPQAVNKAVLNQAQTLFAFRTAGPHERKAIEGWIASKSIDVNLDELPALPTGTCFCWSPFWLRTFAKIRVAKRRTFDSTKTPKYGETHKAGQLTPVDLEKFKATMGEAIERARAADPERLKQRIRDLERDLQVAAVALDKASKAAPAPKVERVEVPMIPDKDLKRLERACLSADAQTTRLLEFLGTVRDEAKGLREVVTAATFRGIGTVPGLQPSTLRLGPAASPSDGRLAAMSRPQVEALIAPMARDAKRRSPAAADSGDGPALGPAHHRVLAAVAALQTAGISAPVAELVAWVSRYSPTSRHYENLRGALRAAGLVEYPTPGRIVVTAAGARATAGVRAATRQDIQEGAASLLEESHRRLLAPLIAAFPDALTAAELADRSGYSVTSRHFENLRGRLRALSLATYPSPGVVRAADDLFVI